MESPVDTGELIATGASYKAEECPHTLLLTAFPYLQDGLTLHLPKPPPAS